MWFDGQPAPKAALQGKVEALLSDGLSRAPIDADSKVLLSAVETMTREISLNLCSNGLGLSLLFYR